MAIVRGLRRVDVPLTNEVGPTVTLQPWSGPWTPDDPDANFKADVALYSVLDPLSTLQQLSRNVDVPLGALVRYVLAKYATAGSGAALELGPSATSKLAAFIDEAEAAGTDAARLRAYEGLRDYISWLRIPFDQPDAY